MARTAPTRSVRADGTNTYLYGNDRLAQYQASMQYFGADGLGSVRQIFDASAMVVGSARYDPYGNVMAQSGATSVFAFAGEQQDASGLTYLRARYYSAAQGRFTTRDAWEGDPNAPMSYNAWLYGYANSVNLTDPTGRVPTSPPGLTKECKDWLCDWFPWLPGCKPAAPTATPLPTPTSAPTATPTLPPTATPPPSDLRYQRYGFSLQGFTDQQAQTLGVAMEAYAKAIGDSQLAKIMLADSGGLERVSYDPNYNGAPGGRNTGWITLGPMAFDMALAGSRHYDSWGANNAPEFTQRIFAHEVAHVTFDVTRKSGTDWPNNYKNDVKRQNWVDQGAPEEEAATNVGLGVLGAPYYNLQSGSVPEQNADRLKEIDDWFHRFLDALKRY